MLQGVIRLLISFLHLEPCNEWTQTSNIAKDTNITGFKAMKLVFPDGYILEIYVFSLETNSDLLGHLLDLERMLQNTRE